MTKEKIDELVTISREKYKLLEDMCKYTIAQKEYIEKEDMDSLNELLDKKDTLIKKIDQLDISFLIIFSQVKKEEAVENIEQLDIKKYPNLKELKDVVVEISSILMTLSLLDKENSENIKQKLKATKMELKRVREGQRAYKGYNKTEAGSMMIDEKK
ncbi:FlgN protein [Keratinibaculum paraultunense]|uniref:FlgN protein n=1 Tax=Keratinibaculum paraultunense TaxID=1278232 RepID=A0A4R3KZ63_9FIRM|nr:flagellar protein FlgN [Keratinibaculum paraultunense]QQY80083.1 flagellar export chaperone FlgN [Keratinibaculum paraultunense]TCS91596.1 FlgN protein [Keratinibaculum paraultunense]